MTNRPIALVTGGSRGIGAAICRALADEYHVLVGGRDEAKMAQMVESLPSAEPFCCDLLDESAITAAVAKLDRLDVLVHNAGITSLGTIAEQPHQAWVDVLLMNVVAVADLTRACLPLLRASKGTVVAINSGSGYTSKPHNGVYSASKFALRAFTECLREEERGKIKVVSIHPGRVDTEMQVQMQDYFGRDYDPQQHMRPESVAHAVKFAIATGPDATIENVIVRPVVS